MDYKDNVLRISYLKDLNNSTKDNKIKALTGIRQCGKTTILDMFFEELRKSGVDDDHLHVLKLSTFDPLNKYKTPTELNDFIKESITDNQMHYFMIDEIQECVGFEKVLISAKETIKNARIYITGSNSKMLSEEIVRKLGDNVYKIEVYPLSFKEYVDFFNVFREEPLSKYELFEKFLDEGGMPDIVKSPNTKDNIFLGINETIINNDILSRHSDLDKAILKRIIKYLSTTFGKRFSEDNVLKSINKGRRSILDVTDIEYYLECIKESYFLIELGNPIAGKDVLKADLKKKFYVIDHSLGNFLANGIADRGDTLENIVYLQLLRLKAKNVTVGRESESGKEIDFVFDDKKGVKHFVQIAQEMDDEETELREFSSFDSITYTGSQERVILLKENYSGSLGSSYPNIKVLRLADWLLSDSL